MSTPSRRGFLSNLFFGHIPDVQTRRAHTLVCIFLRGGADALNMIVPYADDQYYRSRPTLSIDHPQRAKDKSDAAIRLDDFYALHPRMAPLLPAFGEGRLGIVQGVGTDNPTGSHFEAQDQIEHGEGFHGRGSIGGGWLGRHLRSRAVGGDSPLAGVAMGPTLPEALRGAPAASAFSSIDEIHLPAASGDTALIARTLGAMYAAEAGLLGQHGKETINLLKKVQTLRDTPYQPKAGVAYPDHAFGHRLREVARLIKADVGLEAACVDLDGWDTHFFQGAGGGQLGGLVDLLARGLAAFDLDLVSHRQHVTTVVLTEFGRRLYENGSAGTDHGRGFAMMAIGDRINGGKIHGDWPGFEDDPIFPGPGGLQVKIDYRSVLSEILTGPVGNKSIDKIFPGFAPQLVGLVA